MNNEPTPKDESTDWVMPEPIFRTSSGRTPKTAGSYVEPDDIDTEAPDSEDYAFDDIDTEIPNVDEGDIEDAVYVDPVPSPPITVSPVHPQDEVSKRGCAKSFLLIVGVIGFVVLAVVAGIIYYFYGFIPTEPTTF